MTKEEIIEFNKGVTEHHSGTHVDSGEKAAQPEYTEEMRLALLAAEGNAQRFINSVASNL